MDTIAEIKTGWKWLQGTLNDLVKAINRRTINSGIGIDVKESASGVIIGLQVLPTPTGGGGGTAGAAGTGLTTAQKSLLTSLATTPAGQAATWQVLNVVVQTETGYELQNVYYWGGLPFGP